jgi:hypothetical protein
VALVACCAIKTSEADGRSCLVGRVLDYISDELEMKVDVRGMIHAF